MLYHPRFPKCLFPFDCGAPPQEPTGTSTSQSLGHYGGCQSKPRGIVPSRVEPKLLTLDLIKGLRVASCEHLKVLTVGILDQT